MTASYPNNTLRPHPAATPKPPLEHGRQSNEEQDDAANRQDLENHKIFLPRACTAR